MASRYTAESANFRSGFAEVPRNDGKAIENLPVLKVIVLWRVKRGGPSVEPQALGPVLHIDSVVMVDSESIT